MTEVRIIGLSLERICSEAHAVANDMSLSLVDAKKAHEADPKKRPEWIRLAGAHQFLHAVSRTLGMVPVPGARADWLGAIIAVLVMETQRHCVRAAHASATASLALVAGQKDVTGETQIVEDIPYMLEGASRGFRLLKHRLERLPIKTQGT